MRGCWRARAARAAQAAAPLDALQVRTRQQFCHAGAQRMIGLGGGLAGEVIGACELMRCRMREVQMAVEAAVG